MKMLYSLDWNPRSQIAAAQKASDDGRANADAAGKELAAPQAELDVAQRKADAAQGIRFVSKDQLTTRHHSTAVAQVSFKVALSTLSTVPWTPRTSLSFISPVLHYPSAKYGHQEGNGSQIHRHPFKSTRKMSAPMQDPGEKSLSRLLATLSTILHPTTYVFATVKDEAKLPPVSAIQLFFRETEGLTVITSLDYAKSHGLEYFFPCKMITLDVTSSLEAVGFMAVIATRLATKDMGVNPVSGFYHDHLFVPLGRENEAIEMLKELAEEKRSESTSWAGDVSHK
ncbi:hypothetical protein MAA_11626 [Metarhizium robertsii ARSEF 23]|uniref:DUF2241 domain-containing protein n=2 Tax=Metarhizium robertsii TaxID=568076 RepID=A0A0B2XDF8_METRA|nr:uncharacterized protein MAA_11626 [Metarhizium robertsii ARSEF 23]KHO10780.1 hypothetical protein MAA_11626 [Metarhizium robertsii ARSEF 23]